MTNKRVGIFGVLAVAGAALAAMPASAATHFSVGIGVGPAAGYYAAPPAVYARPPYPGPGYDWIDGYYDPYGAWIAGYWAPRAYVAPRFNEYRFNGSRGDFDRDDRRFDRDRGRGKDFGRRR